MKHYIREHRIRKGWTQHKLAQAGGWFDSQVSDWEAGKRRPGVASMFRLAEVFGVTVDDLTRPPIKED